MEAITADPMGRYSCVPCAQAKPFSRSIHRAKPTATLTLLARPSWRMRLAFFPADSGNDKPDYELGMRLLDNGVSRDMVLDYGEFAIKARLNEIEALPKPRC